MVNQFSEEIFRTISRGEDARHGKILKPGQYKIAGKTKIELLEESHDGVKIVLNKDENDQIKEIKFICSCGETKSLFLDYSE
ncbi:MAG: hypothetical protein D6830_00760 [Ignavibacteria bacterium]|nr:MAG: hypothetical protein D6830_00760 [Ignavibacteria bacterium]